MNMQRIFLIYNRENLILHDEKRYKAYFFNTKRSNLNNKTYW